MTHILENDCFISPVEDFMATQVEQRKILESNLFTVGSIVNWHDRESRVPYIYTRVTHCLSTGFIVDYYPEGTLPFVIPYNIVFPTSYGFSIPYWMDAQQYVFVTQRTLHKDTNTWMPSYVYMRPGKDFPTSVLKPKN